VAYCVREHRSHTGGSERARAHDELERIRQEIQALEQSVGGPYRSAQQQLFPSDTTLQDYGLTTQNVVIKSPKALSTYEVLHAALTVASAVAYGVSFADVLGDDGLNRWLAGGVMTAAMTAIGVIFVPSVWRTSGLTSMLEDVDDVQLNRSLNLARVVLGVLTLGELAISYTLIVKAIELNTLGENPLPVGVLVGVPVRWWHFGGSTSTAPRRTSSRRCGRSPAKRSGSPGRWPRGVANHRRCR
jgi:hypothetical protein